MRWDLFCRVVDNLGDIGVCWRLAADLASRGERLRLWVDDPSPLAWMAPGGAPGVQVVPWTEAPPALEPGDVVVEAFGCDPPPDFVARMAARTPPPLWINLEYLSAEPYVVRCHGLPSPQSAGPGDGLIKWFYYPGFEAGTGGLIREPGLMEARRAFDADAWLRRFGGSAGHGERRVALFCYDTAPVDALLDHLAQAPTLLLLTPGAAQRLVTQSLRERPRPGTLRCVPLPWLTQPDFDRLLWACDLNFVRGEDSFVRALWAGVPFVWQVYPQHDGAHAVKLQAFLARYLQGAAPAVAGPLRALWQAWNGLGPAPGALPDDWPPAAAWREHGQGWRGGLLAQPDLGTQLLAFVRKNH